MRKGLVSFVVVSLGLVGCGKTDATRCDDICAKDKECGYVADEVVCRAVCKDSLNAAGSACSASLASVDDCYSDATCSTLSTCNAKYAVAYDECGWGGAKTDAERCSDICVKTDSCDATTNVSSCTAACNNSLTGASTTCLSDLDALDICYATTSCADLSNFCLSTYTSTANTCYW